MRTVLALMCCSALAGAGIVLMWPLGQWSTPLEEPAVVPVVLVEQIREMARLNAASMPVTTTVHGSRGQGWIQQAAGEELVFLAVGEVTAGVDLREVTAGDISVVDGVVHVDLPPAQIWSVALDEQRSSVQHRSVGWVGRADPHFETRARREAVRRMRVAAEQSDLRQRAQEVANEAIAALIKEVSKTSEISENNPKT